MATLVVVSGVPNSRALENALDSFSVARPEHPIQIVAPRDLAEKSRFHSNGRIRPHTELAASKSPPDYLVLYRPHGRGYGGRSVPTVVTDCRPFVRKLNRHNPALAARLRAERLNFFVPDLPPYACEEGQSEYRFHFVEGPPSDPIIRYSYGILWHRSFDKRHGPIVSDLPPATDESLAAQLCREFELYSLRSGVPVALRSGEALIVRNHVAAHSRPPIPPDAGFRRLYRYLRWSDGRAGWAL